MPSPSAPASSVRSQVRTLCVCRALSNPRALRLPCALESARFASAVCSQILAPCVCRALSNPHALRLPCALKSSRLASAVCSQILAPCVCRAFLNQALLLFHMAFPSHTLGAAGAISSVRDLSPRAQSLRDSPFTCRFNVRPQVSEAIYSVPLCPCDFQNSHVLRLPRALKSTRSVSSVRSQCPRNSSLPQEVSSSTAKPARLVSSARRFSLPSQSRLLSSRRAGCFLRDFSIHRKTPAAGAAGVLRTISNIFSNGSRSERGSRAVRSHRRGSTS